MEEDWSRFLALLDVAEWERLKWEGRNDSKRAAPRIVLSGLPEEKRIQLSQKRSQVPAGNSGGGVKSELGLILKISMKRLRNEEDEAKTSSRPNKVMKVELQPFSLTDSLKNKIRGLGGSESSITLVFRKVLTQTDVSHHQNRLLIPFTQVENHSFLTDEERRVLEKSCVGNCVKIPAMLIDASCNLYHMNLALWHMHKNKSYYCLQKQWRDVVKQNHLKPGDSVNLWGFRTHSHLGFILSVVY